MADYILKVDTQVMLDTAGKIETQKTYMENYLSDINTKINALQQYFQGEAGTEFVTKFGNVTKEITASLTNLSNVITALKSANTVLETGNTNAKNEVDKLGTADIFK